MPVPFNLETLLAIEFVAMAGAESLRGSQEDPEQRKYPGGPFDPAGLAKVPSGGKGGGRGGDLV